MLGESPSAINEAPDEFLMIHTPEPEALYLILYFIEPAAASQLKEADEVVILVADKFAGMVQVEIPGVYAQKLLV